MTAAIFHRGMWKAARFAGRCSRCSSAVIRGDRVLWIPRFRRTLCRACGVDFQAGK